MLKYLGADIPTERETQQKFFEPDVSHLPKKDAEMCLRRGKDLRRTLVDHNGMSPIGLLRWCLQYAGESGGPTVAVFGVVKQRFAAVPSEIYKLVSTINTFRNDYVAHQNKELTDAVIAAEALGEWVSGLCRIWRFYG
jgi:type III restriction enzyme